MNRAKMIEIETARYRMNIDLGYSRTGNCPLHLGQFFTIFDSEIIDEGVGSGIEVCVVLIIKSNRDLAQAYFAPSSFATVT